MFWTIWIILGYFVILLIFRGFSSSSLSKNFFIQKN